MPITLNPNRINVSSGSGRSVDRRQSESDSPVIVPKRAHVNYIPAPESLKTMILSAVAALRRGVYWDRGTILNLLV